MKKRRQVKQKLKSRIVQGMFEAKLASEGKIESKSAEVFLENEGNGDDKNEKLVNTLK